jgi:hypothetical protein
MAYTGTSVAGGEGNTTFNATNVEFLGKNLEFITIDYLAAVNGKTAKDSTQYVAELTMQKYANLVGGGPLADSNTQKTYMIEHTDAFVGSGATSGTGAFTLTTTTDGAAVATLQTAIQALGTVDSIDLSSATASASKLAILTAAIVA